LSASGNNLGDVGLVRRSLEVLLTTTGARESGFSDQAAKMADWLLVLSETNQNDVYLAARVYDAVGNSFAVLRLLEPGEREIPEGLYGAMAKAMFNTGDAAAFGRWWDMAGEEVKADPLLGLYHAAWKVGWGPEEEQEAYRRKLEEAANTLDRRLLANRLFLRVARQRRDLQGYREALKRLEGFQGDRMADHADYWRMLQDANRREEALRLARNHPYPPRHAVEVAQYGMALSTLGDKAEARRILMRYGPTLGDGPAVICLPIWALLGDLLIAEEAWADLIRVGKDIRSLPRGSTTMSGFGAFLEGRALVELGDREGAGERFDTVIREGLPAPVVHLEIGSMMLRLGFPERAQRLLLPMEESLGDRVRYWQALFEVAYALRKDEALLFKAARRALQLEPNSPVRQINYAAALLVTRQRPDEAVRLTLAFSAAHEGSTLALLNHAQALAMVGRGAEAAQKLSQVPPPTNRDAATAHALVELEIGLVRGEVEAARAAMQRVDEKYLFPSQVQWLAQVRELLDATPRG
jgi:tetratricopeptide (TPR) repeat protein